MMASGIHTTECGANIPYVVAGGERRLLAALPSPADLSGLPRYSASFDLIPESEWREISYADYDVPIMDQGQHGSCVAHGAAMAFSKAWLIAGNTPPPGGFSPTFVYALGNGGRDAGMVISDAGQILMTKGICSAQTFPEGRIWRQQLPSNAMDEAANYVVGDVYHGDSWEAIGTALQRNEMVFFGIYVSSNFEDFDSEGVPPAYRSMGNHCVTADGLRRLHNTGRWSLDGINSWSKRWGNDGRMQLVKNHINSYTDAVIIRFVKTAPREENVPA